MLIEAEMATREGSAALIKSKTYGLGLRIRWGRRLKDTKRQLRLKQQ